MAKHRRTAGAAQVAIPDQRGPGSARHCAVGITDARTEVQHLVTDETISAERHSGQYLGLCGKLVLAASLTAPEKGHCQSCRQVVVVARGSA